MKPPFAKALLTVVSLFALLGSPFGSAHATPHGSPAASLPAPATFNNPTVGYPNGASYNKPINPFARAGYKGQCTAFAWGRAHEVLGITNLPTGNGKTWLETAKKANFSTGTSPRANSIAVWEGDTVNPYGHVAYVEDVQGDNVTFNEANIKTYVNTNAGGGYDGSPKTYTAARMANRGRGVGKLMGYIYLTAAPAAQGRTPNPAPGPTPAPAPAPTSSHADCAAKAASALETEKEAVVGELRSGHYCKICGMTPTEFRKMHGVYEEQVRGRNWKLAGVPAAEKTVEMKIAKYDRMIQEAIARLCKILLDPGKGGMSIGADALQPGDIIVSTTEEDISGVIRWASKADVSHAMLYIGRDKVVEAISGGVTVRSLEEATRSSSLAVAYRRKELTPEQAKEVVRFALLQGANGSKYNYAGVIFHPSVRLPVKGMIWYVVGGAWKFVSLKQNRFFCSELIFEAFRVAGLPLTKNKAATRYSSRRSAPGDIPLEEKLDGTLEYVGHIKTKTVLTQPVPHPGPTPKPLPKPPAPKPRPKPGPTPTPKPNTKTKLPKPPPIKKPKLPSLPWP